MDEEIFEVEQVEEVVVELEESAGWVSSENILHSTLPDHNDPGAHEISAINGLATKLEELEKPKTVYSDGYNIANYYKWKDSKEGSLGYFVSLASDTEVVLCNGQNGIFGVIVDAAGFVGRQDILVPKETDDTYKLIVTSGHTLVRHELDVALGDYVVSNTSGYAKKSGSGRGYKVFAFADVNGTSYAVISLDIQGDTIDKLGAEVKDLDTRLVAAETNITVANNVAQEALSKANDIDTSKLVTSDKIEAIEDAANKAEADASDALVQATNAATTSAQAKAIAESAVLTAETMKDEAVKDATEAVLSSSELRDEFSAMDKQINDLEGQVTIVTKKASGRYETVDTISGVDKEEDIIYYAKDTETYHYYDYDIPSWAETKEPREAGLSVAIAGLQVETDENSASINSLASWQGTADISMARIEQKADANGAYIQSTVSNMDRYTVGPHSQAYGFTLEQAAGILEDGMIYVPTENVDEEYKLVNEALEWIETDRDVTKVYYKTVEDGDTSKKVYYYADYDIESKTYSWKETEKLPTYKRDFTKSYLYRWGRLGGDGPFRWITVDKDYSELKLNTSGPSVSFVAKAPSTANTTHGYWYKVEEPKDENGEVIETEYELNTLYKWDLPYKYQTKNDNDEIVDVEEYHWIAVATLAGNVSNRAISQIRQDANSIELRVTNAEGSYAGLRAELTATQAIVQQLSTWQDGEEESMASVKTVSDDNGASVVISALQKNGDNIDEMASLVLNVVEDEDGNPTSALSIDADYIQFSGQKLDIKVDATHIDGELTIGQLPNTVAEKSDIKTKTSELENDSGFQNETGVVTIAKGAINADYIETLKLEVGKEIIMGDDAEISWNNVTGREEGVTKIAKDEISTATIRADQVEAEDLNAFGATIGGWTINEDSIEASGIGLYSGTTSKPSLVNVDTKTPVRIYTTPSPTIVSQRIIQNITAENGKEVIEFDLPASVDKMELMSSYLQYAYMTNPDPTEFSIYLEESSREIDGVSYRTLEATVSYIDLDGYFIKPIGDPTLISIEYVDKGSDNDRGDVGVNVRQNFVIEHNVDNQTYCIYCILTTESGNYPAWYDTTYYRYEATIEITYCKNEEDKPYTLTFQMVDDVGRFVLIGTKDYTYEIGVEMKQWSAGAFTVLSDGSLYATNAKISGHIEATSGSFAGKVVAESGTFGGLTIQDGEIYHEATGLSLLSDGDIVVEEFEANNIKVNKNTKVRKLTSAVDDKVYLNLEGNTATTQRVVPKVEATISREYVGRQIDWFTTLIEDAGEVSVVVSTGVPLYNTKDFIVRVYYRYQQYNLFKSFDWNFRIKGEEDRKTIKIPHAKYAEEGSSAIYTYDRVELLTSDAYEETASKSVTAIASSAHFVPTKTDLELGSSNIPWNNIYSSTGTVKTSDANKKNTIQPIDGKYSAMYDMLTPVSFKLNDGTSDRTHTGLTAQGMKAAMDACGIDAKDFAAYCSWTDSDGNESCGIRYEELIALNIYEIQRLKARVKELEEKLKD